MALADEALFGYETWQDLWEQVIPDGHSHVKIRWRESKMNKPILRKVLADGTMTDDMMSRWTFERIFRQLLLNEGYTTRGGVHQIRRTLGKEIHGKKR